MAWGTGAGTEGRELRTASGTTGSDSEEKQLGKWRALGIPCLRDRVVQSSAMLVLSPIFEADLQPEQYAYRAQRSANDAVKRVHSLLNTGHHEVGRCRLVQLFRRDTPCRTDEEYRPSRK